MATPPRSDDGFGPHMGITLAERSEGRAVTTLTVGPQHMNPHGVVHGAVLYALSDQGMGAALYTLLKPGETCATIELKIVYIASVREGVIECETKVINKGSRVAALESEIHSATGKLLAKTLGTFTIFPAR